MPDVQENNNIPIRLNDQHIEAPQEEGEEDKDATKLHKCRKILWKITTSQLGLIIILLGYAFMGASIMQAIEGPNEILEISEIVQLRKDIIAEAWAVSQNASYENFTEFLNNTIRKFEGKIQIAITHGISTGSDEAVWDYWGSLFFCATVFTTIGEFFTITFTINKTIYQA